jgi:hypothetical protein
LNLLKKYFHTSVVGVVIASLFSVSVVAQAAADGITWTSRTSAANNSWGSVTYGNGLFVAVSHDGNVMTSPDGITWTSRTAASNNDWWSVTFGNGLFVAVSLNGSPNQVMTSPDGITWTSRTSVANNNKMELPGQVELLQQVIFGNQLLTVMVYLLQLLKR